MRISRTGAIQSRLCRDEHVGSVYQGDQIPLFANFSKRTPSSRARRRLGSREPWMDRGWPSRGCGGLRRHSRRCPSATSEPSEGFDSTYQVKLGDVGRTWEVQATEDRCVVRTSPTREPDVVIGTDAATWLALREGRLSGLDAFALRRLYARGDLDRAVGFEGLFHLPGGRPPLRPRPRRPRPRSQALHRQRRRRPRGGRLPARARRQQDLDVRDDRGADARAPRARASTCPASGRPRSPRAPPTTPPTSRASSSRSSTRWRSIAPTSSATRWAGASRSRSR